MASHDDHDTAGAGPDYGGSWGEPGPWRADQIQEDERVELSDGHRVDCMGAGGRHGETHMAGAMVLRSDPAVEHAGIDIGIAFNGGKNLRAPDLSVGADMSAPGWTDKAPPLAVEYADHHQDEVQLKKKIGELLGIGTRMIWVVRLVGPLRVEVHEVGKAVRIVGADGQLTAPGILQNPVPVRALIDGAIALEATLDNLLARKGYRSLEAVREEVRAEGLAELREALHAELAERGWSVPAPLQARIAACVDSATLLRWLRQSARAGDLEAALR
jgi:hypothetical protein